MKGIRPAFGANPPIAFTICVTGPFGPTEGQITMPVISADKLKALSIRIFTAAGVNQEGAERVASPLVESNLVGMDSHGVMRLPTYVERAKKGPVACNNRVEGLQGKGATEIRRAHAAFAPF